MNEELNTEALNFDFKGGVDFCRRFSEIHPSVDSIRPEAAVSKNSLGI